MRVFQVRFTNLSSRVAIREKGWFRRLNAHDEEHIKASLDSVGVETETNAWGLYLEDKSNER